MSPWSALHVPLVNISKSMEEMHLVAVLRILRSLFFVRVLYGLACTIAARTNATHLAVTIINLLHEIGHTICSPECVSGDNFSH